MALFLQSSTTRQTNICGFGFGSVPVTALLVYLFQLVSVIFTYLRAGCPCDVRTFLDLTSFRLLIGSGRVTDSEILTRFRLCFTVSALTTGNQKQTHFVTYYKSINKETLTVPVVANKQ